MPVTTRPAAFQADGAAWRRDPPPDPARAEPRTRADPQVRPSVSGVNARIPPVRASGRVAFAERLAPRQDG